MPCPPHKAWGVTPGLTPWGQGGDAEAGSTSTQHPGQYTAGHSWDALSERSLQQGSLCSDEVVIHSDTTVRHSLTSLHPKLLLPSNPCRHTASSGEGCTGTSHSRLGMALCPAPTAAWVTAEGLPGKVGEWGKDLCSYPAVGDGGSVQHAQAQQGVRATSERLGPAALPQLPPMMAW